MIDQAIPQGDESPLFCGRDLGVAGQIPEMLAVPTPSRAGSLPQGILVWIGICGLPLGHCGSLPASDGGVSGDRDVECADAFASRLAPTGDFGMDRDLWVAAGPLWELACKRKRCVRRQRC